MSSNDTLLKATVQKVTYRDMTSGFTILRVQTEEDSETTVLGTMSNTIDNGANIIARGKWNTHPKFGKQFKAFNITEVEPTTEEAIARYLSASGVKGMGEVLAKRIVDKFGDNTLQIIDNDPEKLLEVSGIGQNKLEQIIDTIKEKREHREAYLFFINNGITANLAHKICNTFGSKAVEVVKENPYILVRSVWRIGFATADKIALSIGLSRDSPERLKAGVIHAVRESCEFGNCYLLEEDCLNKAMELLKVDDYQAITLALHAASLSNDVVIENEKVYTTSLFEAEQKLAKNISARLINKELKPEIAQHLIDTISLEPVSGFSKLSEQQKEAIQIAADNHVSIITGGPGCGKTTVLKAIAKLFKKSGLKLKLTAPTGRAAQRLSEVCDHEASTIHRLLKYEPNSKSFIHGPYDLLEIDAIIIDESSMIDLQLASSLFLAIPSHTRILIVGDSDQLPSVGPGTVLSDLIAVKEISQIKLNQIFRREEESLINHIALKVNNSEVPKIPLLSRPLDKEAYFLEAEDTKDGANKIEKLVSQFIPSNYPYTHKDISVITPMNQGELGVIALNQKLQSKLVPKMEGTPWIKVNNLEFRLGDKICQRVNNYNIDKNGVFNGEQGEIIGIDTTGKKITAKMWDGRLITYPSNTLHQIDLAYATSIHRSQGSEIPVVVMALHDSHYVMLEKQLIYTGITRAKKLLIIVGTKRALDIACKTSKSRKRNSDLDLRIKDSF